MNSALKNGVITHTGTFVLEDQAPEDVAQAMIEGGRQKEPFYLFNMDEAYRRIKHFKEMMPRIQIFYAMKANDSDMMLKLAVSQGLGFDCASPGEIHKIKQMNVNPLSIIYAIPTKTPEQMIFARKSGVKHTTFDTSQELKKIQQYWPDAKLLIRIRVDGDSIYKLGEKFGCDFETEAVDLLDEAARLGLNVVGVAFHVGSVCSSIDSHVVGLRQARMLFDHEASAGRRMRIVDIGGGFLSDKTDRIDKVAPLINSTVDELFPDSDVQVIAEPGRYLCDSSADLYCSICNVRRIKKDNKPVNMLYINEGLFGTLRYTEPWHTVTKFKRSAEDNEEQLEDTILWGPSCDSTDRVMRENVVRLPSCTSLDWLVFRIKGAYTFGFASNFSCLEKPLTRCVISSELWNKINRCPVFRKEDFVLNPDIYAPLPSTMPPTPSVDRVSDDIQTSTLI